MDKNSNVIWFTKKKKKRYTLHRNAVKNWVSLKVWRGGISVCNSWQGENKTPLSYWMCSTAAKIYQMIRDEYIIVLHMLSDAGYRLGNL